MHQAHLLRDEDDLQSADFRNLVLPADCPPVASDSSQKAAIVVSFADWRQPF
jgi:hypothetical protein